MCDSPLILGVSGGVDSMVLLNHLSKTTTSPIVVAHFNHQLRGEESFRDEIFTKKQSLKFNAVFETASADISSLAKDKKISVEDCARQSRHLFFARLCKTYHAEKVFLAHHADDQVETVLFRLFRGSGARGLTGIREAQKISTPEGEFEIHRPLLDWSRSSIQKYAAFNRVEHIQDSSNSSNIPSRNFLRNEVIPLVVSRFGLSSKTSVVRASNILLAEDDYMHTEAQKHLTFPDLSSKKISTIHPALGRRVVHEWLVKSGVPSPDSMCVETVLGMCNRGGQHKVNLPSNMFVHRTKGILKVYKPATGEAKE